MPAPAPRRRRPRPLADLPLERDEELASAIAKGWLLELIDAAPLDAADAVPAGAISSEGPLLVDAMLQALGSDAGLARLQGDGDLEPLAAALPRLAGASDAATAVRAVELLREVLVAACSSAGVPDDDAAALGERTALVAATVAETAVAGLGGEAVAEADGGAKAPGRKRPNLSVKATPELERLASSAPDGAIDIVAARARLATSAREQAGEGEGARPLWVVALERQAASGGRFALLLVEVDGVDKLKASSGEAVFARVGRALREQVRRADLIAHEPDGRAWVVSPDCGRVGAEALAERLASAVERVAAPRGAALTASIGLAYFPADGRDADALIEAAEEQMFAARAAGVRVVAGADEASE